MKDVSVAGDDLIVIIIISLILITSALSLASAATSIAFSTAQECNRSSLAAKTNDASTKLPLSTWSEVEDAYSNSDHRKICAIHDQKAIGEGQGRCHSRCPRVWHPFSNY